MAISSVNFGTNTSWAQTISKPQAFAEKEVPVAATGINGKNTKKSGAGKAVLCTVLVAGATAAGLAYGANKGKFKPKDGASETVKTLMNLADKAGKKILSAGKFLCNKGKEIFNAIKDRLKPENVAQTMDDASDVVVEVAEEVVENVVQ